MISPIAKVEALPVREVHVGKDSLDGSVDTVLVRLTDADGRTGIGECDAPPEVVKAFLEMPTAHVWSRNPTEILVGADPVEIAALWERSTTARSPRSARAWHPRALRRSTWRCTISPASSSAIRPTS